MNWPTEPNCTEIVAPQFNCEYAYTKINGLRYNCRYDVGTATCSTNLVRDLCHPDYAANCPSFDTISCESLTNPYQCGFYSGRDTSVHGLTRHVHCEWNYKENFCYGDRPCTNF